MHEIPLLINISIALATAFAGGLLARRLRLPAIVGYLFAGIAIGPFTPGFVGDIETISQLAELGVIFLMFGVGLHFSLRDLWKVRHIAVPGALGQMLLATLLGFFLSRSWGWSISASIVLGLSISIASTVVLLRGLVDQNLLNTPHGRVAVGWLVLEDLATIFILILMPSLSGRGGGVQWSELGFTLLKAALFVALMFFLGKRFIPWILDRIAHTRSRELFILAVLVIALITALGAAELFTVSLALGAFAAGAIVSESPLSYQVGADVLPFREAFAVLFFVSVGMLVNPDFLLANFVDVAALTFLIIFGKAIITMLLGLFIPGQGKTFLVVAAGLSQIGEFSFIIGQGALMLGIFDRNQYSLLLAASLLSIMVNPLLFRFLPNVERSMQRFPAVWKLFNREAIGVSVPRNQNIPPVVLVGYGRVGRHLINLLRPMGIPLVIIEADADRVEELNGMQIPTIYGDAANSEVLLHAGLESARALVVTVPEQAAAELIVAAAHMANPDLVIVARAATEEGIRRLADLGARFVIHPELEGGLEMVRHTLLQLGFPLREVDGYSEEVRSKHYEFVESSNANQHVLRKLMRQVGEIEINWLEIPENSPLIGATLAQSDLRGQTGASVVALVRNGKLSANPKSSTIFREGDRIGVISDPKQLSDLERLLNN
ncbi:MAG: cation:proton antiporter [Anaerolineales bacterium]